jgi:hypothetical protein
MFLKKFLKQQFISFYFNGEKYVLLSEIYKNDKLLENKQFEFDSKKEVFKKIDELSSLIPQTFISIVIQTLNQGVVSGCKKEDFLKYGVDLENVKFICINNQYAFYASIYDLRDLRKEGIDFIYSMFAIIDYLAKIRINTLYLIVLKNKFYLLIYNKNTPIFSDIYEKKEELKVDEEDISLDDIVNDEIVEDIDDDLIDDIDDLEDIEDEVETNKLNTAIEMDIINFIKSSLEEYYQKYADDFVENIVIFDDNLLNEDIVKMISDTLFIDVKKESINLLETINKMSRENV